MLQLGGMFETSGGSLRLCVDRRYFGFLGALRPWCTSSGGAYRSVGGDCGRGAVKGLGEMEVVRVTQRGTFFFGLIRIYDLSCWSCKGKKNMPVPMFAFMYFSHVICGLFSISIQKEILQMNLKKHHE